MIGLNFAPQNNVLKNTEHTKRLQNSIATKVHQDVFKAASKGNVLFSGHEGKVGQGKNNNVRSSKQEDLRNFAHNGLEEVLQQEESFNAEEAASNNLKQMIGEARSKIEQLEACKQQIKEYANNQRADESSFSRQLQETKEKVESQKLKIMTTISVINRFAQEQKKEAKEKSESTLQQLVKQGETYQKRLAYLSEMKSDVSDDVLKSDRAISDAKLAIETYKNLITLYEQTLKRTEANKVYQEAKDEKKSVKTKFSEFRPRYEEVRTKFSYSENKKAEKSEEMLARAMKFIGNFSLNEKQKDE